MARGSALIVILLAACAPPPEGPPPGGPPLDDPRMDSWSVASRTMRSDGTDGALSWSILHRALDVIAEASNGDFVEIRHTTDGLEIVAPGCAMRLPVDGEPSIDGDDIERCFGTLSELHDDLRREVLVAERERGDTEAVECAAIPSWKRTLITCTAIAAPAGGVLQYVVAARGRGVLLRIASVIIPFASLCGTSSIDAYVLRDYCTNPGTLRAEVRPPGTELAVHLEMSVDSNAPAQTVGVDTSERLSFVVVPPVGNPYTVEHPPIRRGYPRLVRIEVPAPGEYRILATQSWHRNPDVIVVNVPGPR